jgi:hypothetical protein
VQALAGNVNPWHLALRRRRGDVAEGAKYLEELIMPSSTHLAG